MLREFTTLLAYDTHPIRANAHLETTTRLQLRHFLCLFGAVPTIVLCMAIDVTNDLLTYSTCRRRPIARDGGHEMQRSRKVKLGFRKDDCRQDVVEVDSRLLPDDRVAQVTLQSEFKFKFTMIQVQVPLG